MPESSSKLQPAVVLVADRTLSADYRILFEGIFGTLQTTQVPELAMRHFVSPAAPVYADGRAKVAPLGIRRVEAALLREGLSRGDVACATPESLPRLIGPWTRLVCVSSGDPLGMGMSNTTTSQFAHGGLYTKVWTDRMMARLVELKARHSFRIAFGGAGAWQYLQNPDEARRHGIDTIFEGYFERQGPAMVRDWLAGKPMPEVVREVGNAIDRVAPIVGPSVMGAIELSRGCGKACNFCPSGLKAMEHLGGDLILQDLQTNVAAGVRSVVSGSEDFFRYGAVGPKVQFEALRSLLERMRQVKGLRFMQIDHGNISSVLQFSDAELTEIRRLLTWESPTEYLWVNMGIESASGRLVQANSPGKMAPYRAEDWQDMVLQAADKMIRCGFFPVLSLVLGLPGEMPEDVRLTRQLVEKIATRRAVIFPIFYEPVQAESRRRGEKFELSRMTLDHLELFASCYEINFGWVPKLYWDNQAAGGVSRFKRVMVQMLGKVETFTWRRKLASLRKQIVTTSQA